MKRLYFNSHVFLSDQCSSVATVTFLKLLVGFNTQNIGLTRMLELTSNLFGTLEWIYIQRMVCLALQDGGSK